MNHDLESRLCFVPLSALGWIDLAVCFDFHVRFSLALVYLWLLHIISSTIHC